MTSKPSDLVKDMETADDDSSDGCSSSPEDRNGLETLEEKPLTKSQLKKMKKKEKWLLVKAQKRKAEKERQKARKRECRERGEELGPTRKQLSKNKMANSSCRIKVAIDCDFDEFMAEKDIKMLVKQVQFSYSANRRAQSPMQFYCCGVSNKTKERLETLGDYKGWDINFRSESFDEVFDKSSVVYLSSESPNVLQSLEEDKVYIIGGLVDHNHHKGLCHKMAEAKGLTHAQLPITEYIDMKTRKVLTINHVFEILLRYTESKDWQKAFYAVLPPRKGAILKNLTDAADKSDDTVTNIGRKKAEEEGTVSSDKIPNSNESFKSIETSDKLLEQVSDDVNVTNDLNCITMSDSMEKISSQNTNVKLQSMTLSSAHDKPKDDVEQCERVEVETSITLDEKRETNSTDNAGTNNVNSGVRDEETLDVKEGR